MLLYTLLHGSGLESLTPTGAILQLAQRTQHEPLQTATAIAVCRYNQRKELTWHSSTAFIVWPGAILVTSELSRQRISSNCPSDQCLNQAISTSRHGQHSITPTCEGSRRSCHCNTSSSCSYPIIKESTTEQSLHETVDTSCKDCLPGMLLAAMAFAL